MPKFHARALVCLIATAFSINLAQIARAGQAAASATAEPSGYNQPPKYILDVLHAPSPPSPRVNPTHDTILLVSWQQYPPMSRVATPYLRLAGVRIEPGNHSKHDTPGGYGITACAQSFEIVHVANGKRTPVAFPTGACPGSPIWSADGRSFAFVNLAPSAVELWIGNAKTGHVHSVPGVRLNPMFGSDLQWMPDQASLLVKLVPDGMGAPPPELLAPMGPSIQETDGRKGQSSTYENRDTLNNRHDEDLFDYYAAAQLALVDASTSAITPVGNPGNYMGVHPAPDGRHVLVSAIHKPYSYVTTFNRFPHSVEVWDISDRAHASSKILASLPLADRVPIHGVPMGPRDFSWRPTDPATLIWAEALDGGDWNTKVPNRDRVFLQKAPFTAPPVEIALTEQRYSGYSWTEKPSVALLEEEDDNRHWSRTFIMNVDNLAEKPRLLWDLSTDEHYADPGSPVYRVRADGTRVVQLDGDAIFLSGNGSSTDGDRPFLDRLNLKTLETERLFRSVKNAYEQFLGLADASFPSKFSFLSWHQSVTDPPNAFQRALGKRIPAAPAEATYASDTRPITHIADPTPQVRAIQKRLVKYKRADGLDLSFTLYTPPGYKEGTRVPTILYAYPLDYADASKAGQVTGSHATFTRLLQYRLLLLAGYAIIDNAAFPIVGDPKKAYDAYMEQLVADATAAVDEAVRLGVTDPERVGVTGHSHGALMTVNLVAHSDLFRAGVATSGSYNKTLTPFGFQSERRSVWEAPDVYKMVSPFFSADTIKTPLLIIHGAEDANPGTTPLQASKLFEAIRGNGGTTRLVVLPHEPHWYSAMESQEQLIYEMVRWFDKYVKDAPARTAAVSVVKSQP
ncbi:MAG: prolyl oligopeptidase family serine peptidase [Acidobacteriota bacterium]